MHKLRVHQGRPDSPNCALAEQHNSVDGAVVRRPVLQTNHTNDGHSKSCQAGPGMPGRSDHGASGRARRALAQHHESVDGAAVRRELQQRTCGLATCDPELHDVVHGVQPVRAQTASGTGCTKQTTPC